MRSRTVTPDRSRYHLPAIPDSPVYQQHATTSQHASLKSLRLLLLILIGVGDGRAGGGHVPPKILEKIFFGQLLCKIRAFFGQINVKFGNFVNFSEKF